MSAGYLRYPHIHGDLLTFAAGDEVWLAPAAGGRAWRLSADDVPVSYPRFSRDGSQVAWTSWRDGSPEVYAAGTEGSAATRLTYWGDPATRVAGWTAAGEVLAVTAANQPAQKYRRAYAVPGDGVTPPRLLPFGAVTDLAVEDAGTALLTGSVAGEYAFWKRYRGGRTGRLWLATPADPLFTQVLADLGGQLASPMLTGGRLFFLSDHEGTGNIYSCALDGGDVRRHTDHDGMYARNPSTDGQRIVYHVAGDIWILDSLEAPESRRLDITLGSPAAARAPRLVSAKDHLGALSCDRTGQASVVEVRGTVHWLTHKDGPARALHVDQAARARLPRVLGETGQVAWVTDAAGADALEVASTAGEADSRILAAGALGYVIALTASPDGTTVAASARDGRLLIVDVASGQVTELATSDSGLIEGLSWSPDSAWLAWSEPVGRSLHRIRMARIPDGEVIDVTDGRFADTSPVFTLDGRYLAFLSQRSFDPVYDAHTFDLSFPFGGRPYLVPLAADTPSPFGPVPEGRPLGQDNGDETLIPADPPAVTVDADGLATRVLTVPVEEGRYHHLGAVKGGLTWLRSQVSGVLGEGGAGLDDDRPRPSLQRFDLRKREVKELAGVLDWYRVSGDGTRLVIRDHDELRVVPSARKQDDAGESVTVDLTRARFMADPDALWRHAYGEVGRFVRRDFWTPDMSEVDWDGALDAYRPLLDRIRSAADFTDLLWEVLGELGTSHAYVSAAANGWRDYTPVGLLGADLSRDGSGRWVVDRVLPGESSDPRARSPLAAPGAAVSPGDELVAVDGQLVDPARGPWPLLAGTAGKPVELEVRTPSQPDPRRVVVVPLRSDRRLRYQDWVASRRRLVRELSDGRLGYLHIPDMMGEGWAHFHRDLHTEMSRDGLIFDVRGNSGGRISELVVEKLARRVTAWSLGRWRQPRTYPREARRGPMVTVADEFAGSDGDIVTAVVKLLGLGPVVGTRTWGGVVGIEGYQWLLDGSAITVPRFAIYFDEYAWGVENYGVDPDTEVLITPDDAAAGRDTQLETAVQFALEALDKKPPPEAPDVSTGPVKARRPLPPRPGAGT
ncbi:MAG TPA: PDZ domain-containing protein [Streptosporangiaceae bacterium]|nr:PDZ domain-containing protein [Streptosporangiaceae bacterium]